MRSIDSLKPHPLHGNIYRNKDIKDLLASIEDIGILTPLRISPDGTIISGHRRLAAAEQLGWSEVPVVIRATTGKTEEIDQELVESNVQRIRTNEELMREYAQHLEAETRLAKVRQGRRAHRNAGPDNIRANLPVNEESGRARNIAAEKVGVSSRTAVNGLAVIQAIDAHSVTDQDEANELLKVLNEQSINAAYGLATKWGWIEKKSVIKNAAPSEAENPAVVVQEESPGSLVSQKSASIAESSRSAVDEKHPSGAPGAHINYHGESRNGATTESHSRTPAAKKGAPASSKGIEELDAKGRSLLTSDAVLKMVCGNSHSEEPDCVEAIKSVVDKFVGFVIGHLGPEPSSSSVHQTIEVFRSIGDLLLESCSNESGSSKAASDAE